MASLLTLPALALSNPSTSTSGAVRLRAAAFRCWALRRRGWAAAAVASPNSVLSEHAFKRLQLGSGDEDDEEGAYGSDGDEGLEAGEGFQGDEEELAIARLGLPDELVATLEKRGITHLFPIQVNCSLLGSLAFNSAAKLCCRIGLSGGGGEGIEWVFSLGVLVAAFEISDCFQGNTVVAVAG